MLLLHDEGLVSLKVRYIDGTKIESVANKYTFVWKVSTEKNKAKLENDVREVLKVAETALAMENGTLVRGDGKEGRPHTEEDGS